MYKIKQISGQGLVEFALVLPILLLLVIGTLDLGRAFFIKVELENSAREGAYYMVYHRHDFSLVTEAVESTKNAVMIEGENSGITIIDKDKDITITCSDDNKCESRSTVVVTVSHELTMVIDIFFNGPLVLKSDARMLIP